MISKYLFVFTLLVCVLNSSAQTQITNESNIQDDNWNSATERNQSLYLGRYQIMHSGIGGDAIADASFQGNKLIMFDWSSNLIVFDLESQKIILDRHVQIPGDPARVRIWSDNEEPNTNEKKPLHLPCKKRCTTYFSLFI